VFHPWLKVFFAVLTINLANNPLILGVPKMALSSIRIWCSGTALAACILFAGCSHKSTEDSGKKNGKVAPNIKLEANDPAPEDETKTRLDGDTEHLLFPPRETEPKKVGSRIEGNFERLEIPPREADAKDLTNTDIGIDPDAPLKIEVEPVPDITVPGYIGAGPIGVTRLPPELIKELDQVAGIGGLGAGGLGTFQGRSGAIKYSLLRTDGGNDETEAAIAKALAWIAKQQKADGSWEYDGAMKNDKA
jgi:hypothetical protein